MLLAHTTGFPSASEGSNPPTVHVFLTRISRFRQCLASFPGRERVSRHGYDPPISLAKGKPIPSDSSAALIAARLFPIGTRFRRRRLHERPRVLLLAPSSSRGWHPSPYRRPVPRGLCRGSGLARRSPPRFEWRAIPYHRQRRAGASGFAAVEGVLAPRFNALITRVYHNSLILSHESCICQPWDTYDLNLQPPKRWRL